MSYLFDCMPESLPVFYLRNCLTISVLNLRCMRIVLLYRVYQKKGNPTLACHCALIAGCVNVIFARP